MTYPAPTYPNGVMAGICRTLRDIHGDPVSDPWTPSHTVGPCAYTQSSGEQMDFDGETVTINASITAPDGSDVEAGDRVIITGAQFPAPQRMRVIGEIHRPRNPFTGWTPGVRWALAAVK